MQEIERKFLVTSDHFKSIARAVFTVKQGYLCTDPERTVRVRRVGDQGFLTIKGKSDALGTTRLEIEKPLNPLEAEALLAICLPGIIEKKRYEIEAGPHLWEVDVFEGSNQGLVVAEIELNTADESFETPEWIGQEITGDPRYYNAQLSHQPFTSWNV